MSRGRLLLEWGFVLIASMLLVGTLFVSGATSRLDNAFYDVALRLRHQVSPPDIIIVGEDDDIATPEVLSVMRLPTISPSYKCGCLESTSH